MLKISKNTFLTFNFRQIYFDVISIKISPSTSVEFTLENSKKLNKQRVTLWDYKI